MLVDLFPRLHKMNDNLGRKAKGYRAKDATFSKEINQFMNKKDKCQKLLSQMSDNLILLQDLKESYQNAMDSSLETEILNKMNDKNDQNSSILKECNGLLTKMKKTAREYRFDKVKKNSPEARMTVGISNAIQTNVYKILQKSQIMQVEIKEMVKNKISRQIETADPNMSPAKIAEIIDNPEAVQEVLQRKIFASAHGKVRNAIEDLNSKYKELGKLENNMRQLFEMIQDLSMIVKNQTEILNSIEENV